MLRKTNCLQIRAHSYTQNQPFSSELHSLWTQHCKQMASKKRPRDPMLQGQHSRTALYNACRNAEPDPHWQRARSLVQSWLRVMLRRYSFFDNTKTTKNPHKIDDDSSTWNFATEQASATNRASHSQQLSLQHCYRACRPCIAWVRR